MNSLSAAANVLAPAYYLLLERGYAVFHEKESDLWVAQKDGLRLLGYSTIELCGLAYIHEMKGNDWTVADAAIEDYLKLESA
ncbi:hypothetical protein N008_14300 [Hymenobacter sp. APR13]|nr:hypothetical protein N008_14300 [Hymenobacter sp. APR13]